MQAARKQMFVLTDANANNNKFWEVSLTEADVVSTRNGRVGSAGQERILGYGETLYAAKIREKLRKGYREIEIVGSVASPNKIDGEALVTAVEQQIGRGDPVVTELVRDLVKINRHQILEATGGQMQLDLTTGIITTPVGVVTAQNVERARHILASFERYVKNADFDNPGFVSPLEEYLMLVPQKVGAGRGWHRNFLAEAGAVTRQGALLDQLANSIDIAAQRLVEAKNQAGETATPLFDVSMRVTDDKALRHRITGFFEAGKNTRHESHKFGVARIFDMQLGTMARDYEEDGAKVGGIRELWHGTRAHNLISILKSGLGIPKPNGSIHVTGRMFGNGIYFSDQSTKSLNYAYGYWDGGSKDKRCYMFLADVAMGNPWHPKSTGASITPAAGHDSVFARGGRDGVLNNEMIVYRPSQVNLRYLVEFEF